MFEQEIDIVIDIINYLIERAENTETQAPAPKKQPAQSSNRDAFWDYV